MNRIAAIVFCLVLVGHVAFAQEPRTAKKDPFVVIAYFKPSDEVTKRIAEEFRAKGINYGLTASASATLSVPPNSKQAATEVLKRLIKDEGLKITLYSVQEKP